LANCNMRQNHRLDGSGAISIFPGNGFSPAKSISTVTSSMFSARRSYARPSRP
uniref:Transposase n=1 Tax=Gongylonema pulchrum TaxID=637853 RepID=A0A183EQM6_9BILA